MTDPFRVLCAELLADYDNCHYRSEVSDRAHAALAQPEPVAPTDEEIMEVFWEHQNGMEELWVDDWPAAARAVLARYGTSANTISQEDYD